MKLSTIWSLEYISTTERFRRTFDWAAMKTATKLPDRVRYWATITELGKVTRNSPLLTSTPLDEVLKHLSNGRKRH